MKKFYTLMLTAFLLMISSLLFAQTTHTVNIVDSQFQPANLTIQQGDMVVWVNQGAMVHTSTSGTACTGNGIWDSGSLSSGQTFSFVFSNSGAFPYFCIPHCGIGMTGNITVNPGTAIEESQANNKIEIIIKGANPFSEFTVLAIKLNKSTEMDIDLFDLNGKRIQTLFTEKLYAGENIIRIEGNNIEPGIYLLRFRSEEEIIFNKIVKI